MKKTLPRNRNSLAIIVFMLIWSFPQSVCAQAVYVNSSSGDDTSGDGSSGSPYKTFTKGYSQVSNGGTLDLTGIFTWTDAAETGDDGTSGFTISKNITIQGPSSDLAVIQAASSLTQTQRIFKISSGYLVTLQNLELRYGYASSSDMDGGAISAVGNLSVLNCYIHDNMARQGCGLEIIGNLTMENSTVSNNVCTNVQSGLTGGGIKVFSSGTIILTNSTISHNTGVDYGGAMEIDGYTGSGPNVIITNCTIANNSAVEGGGLTTGEGTLQIKNSIVANNTETNVSYGGADIDDWDDATITDNGNNIVGVTNSSQISGTDISSLNLSSTLSDNSTTNGTPTLALSSGSVAINAGNSSANGSVSVPTNDQRGFGRNGITDIGAYEYDGVAPASNTAPTASSFTTSSGPYTNNVYTFSTSDFSYSDSDSDPLDHVRVTAIPGSGTLYVDADSSDDYNSGEELSNGSTVSKANLDAGNLQYYTTSSTSSSFTFDVNDGTDYSVSTYTATLSVSDLSTTTYTGTGNWSDAANWSAGIPGTSTNVTIAGNCIADADYEITDMVINSGAVISISTGNTLTVSGTLTNSAGTSGLIIRSNAGLITSSSVQGTVEKYLTKDVWHYIGMPISYVSDIDDILHGFYVYSLDEANAENGSSSGWTEMAAGDYMIYSYGYAVQYNRPSDNDTTISVSGTLATGTINRAIFKTNQGWNLIANLYPCTIDWSIIDNNLTNKAVYVYNGATYDSWNDGVENGHTQYLAPMQAFFVEAAASETVSYTNSAKTSAPSTFKSANINSIIQLTLTQDSEHFDRTTIRVNQNATMDFEGSMDAHKLIANAGYSEFYTSCGQENFSINAIPEITEETVIPLNIMCEITGEHRLALSELKAFNYSYPIVLFDENKNKVAELENEDYVFDAQKDETKTFYIGFQSTLTSALDIHQSTVRVFNGNHAAIITGLGSGTSRISVYNLSGVKVFEKLTSSNQLTVPLSPAGVYIVNVIPESGNVTTQKVFIN